MRAASLLASLLLAEFPLRTVATAASPSVVVAARPIARGARISEDDVAVSARPAMPLDGLNQPSDAVGLEALRAFSAGTPLRAGGLAAPRVVRRGEPITLRAMGPGFTVEASGVAVADGRTGTPAAALNPSSGRRVRGRIGADSVILLTP